MPSTRDGAPPCSGPDIAPTAPDRHAATSAPVPAMTRALNVHADIAGMDGDREGLGGREAGVERAVDQEPPDVAEGDAPDEILDVDTAVAECAAFLVRFGDLRLERYDSFEPGYEVGHQT